MKTFSRRNLIFLFEGLFLNLTSGWLGVLVVVPGVFGVSTVNEYLRLLIVNFPLGTTGLFFTLWLIDKKRYYA